MARTRGSGCQIVGNPSQRQDTRDVVEAKEYVCMIKNKDKLRDYFYTFCKQKPRSWSSQPLPNIESDTNPLMLTSGDDKRIVGNASTTKVIEDNSKESTSLSKEIDEYMDVRSYMQSMQIGPSRVTTGDENGSSKKKQKTTARVANIVLSSKNEGSPRVKLYWKRRGVRTEVLDNVNPISIASTVSSSPGTLFLWRKELNVNKFLFSLSEVAKQWNSLLPEETKRLFYLGESSANQGNLHCKSLQSLYK
ncbi:hypothetical protein J1N35_014867 [Gossypium stocksii]|uniref:Uncharacterized protein n=1 Tax=Gossypium stocksii TaxID=47602 RepID=A0A9D3VWX9_9ROSI|nr:hypothetical protein J1N35_014867 [Gossypium stocksii]